MYEPPVLLLPVPLSEPRKARPTLKSELTIVGSLAMAMIDCWMPPHFVAHGSGRCVAWLQLALLSITSNTLGRSCAKAGLARKMSVSSFTGSNTGQANCGRAHSAAARRRRKVLAIVMSFPFFPLFLRAASARTGELPDLHALDHGGACLGEIVEHRDAELPEVVLGGNGGDGSIAGRGRREQAGGGTDGDVGAVRHAVDLEGIGARSGGGGHELCAWRIERRDGVHDLLDRLLRPVLGELARLHVAHHHQARAADANAGDAKQRDHHQHDQHDQQRRTSFARSHESLRELGFTTRITEL